MWLPKQQPEEKIPQNGVRTSLIEASILSKILLYQTVIGQALCLSLVPLIIRRQYLAVKLPQDYERLG